MQELRFVVLISWIFYFLPMNGLRFVRISLIGGLLALGACGSGAADKTVAPAMLYQQLLRT